MGRSSKQKINKETQVLNDTLDEMDLIDIFRTYLQMQKSTSLLKCTFSRIEHILGHKSSLSKFNKIEIISSIFSDHNSAAAAKSLQSCPTLCNPIDGSPPGSPVPGILARTLEWVAISFSNAWKWKVKVNSLSHVLPSVTP